MTVGFSLNCSGTYTDFTKWVEIDSLKLIKSLDENNDPQKHSTAEIECSGDAYTFIKTNLIDSVNLYSNSICVRVYDDLCDETLDFKIETKNLRWCEGEVCRININLIEYNPVIDCIKNTVISDNTNGDFQEFPVSGTIHPRFRYCDVIKPTFVFGMLLTIANAISLVVASINALIIATLQPIVVLINSFFGTSFSVPLITDPVSALLGCNRLFPAPLIRVYQENVCNICGVTIDDTTNPIFHDSSSLYFNTALLTAYTTKGVKDSTSKDYIVNNRPSWTLFDLSSKLKMPFNGRFFIKNLGGGSYEYHFNRKDLIGSQLWGAGPNIDISSTGSDYVNLISKPCFQWNGEGKPSRINMNYSNDACDNIGNELLCRFNGEYITPGGNPNYNTPVERQTPDFGAPSFVLDGKDTIWDANLVNAIGVIISGFTYDGVLKTQGDTLALAKLLIWDGTSPIEDAKVVSDDWIPYSILQTFADDEGGFFPVNASDLFNYNFPMSFDPDANAIASGNLWDFHAIDVPAGNKRTNISFEFVLQYCCQYSALDLYMSVLFDSGEEGEVNSIEYDYYKRQIIIKGNLK